MLGLGFTRFKSVWKVFVTKYVLFCKWLKCKLVNGFNKFATFTNILLFAHTRSVISVIYMMVFFLPTSLS